MKIKFLLYSIAFLFCGYLIAETDTTGLSEDIKSKLIYMNASDETSSTTIHYTDGSQQGSGSTRRITLTYTVGFDKTVYGVDKKAEHLKSIVQNDKMAMSHFNKAQECRKKSKLYNLSEITFEIAAVGGTAWIFARASRNKSAEYEADKKPLVVPIVVGATGWVGFYYCWFKSHKMLTKYMDHMVGCVDAYNRSIINGDI